MFCSLRSHDIRLFISVLGLVLAGPALAQDNEQAAKRPEVNRAPALSSNATVNLINLLVKQDVLTSEQAAALIKQAEEDAYIARQATRDATAKAQAADMKADAASRAASPPGTKRVTYVPEIVKQQLRDEIRSEVMAKAEKENWASPGKYPEWAQRIRFSGDIRMRAEGQFYPKGNGAIQDFNATNTGSPFQEPNISGSPNLYLPPTLNTQQDRDRFRLRARLGADILVTDSVTAGLRFATGENSSPVSLNQSMGASGGNFSKYNLWIDRAFIKYEPLTGVTGAGVTGLVGRFDNPFFSATDLVWASDLGFDGAAVKARYEVVNGITPFFVAGAFPVYSTPLNASINTRTVDSGATSQRSANKWLLGAQIGAVAQVQEATTLTTAVSYYDFTDVRGKLSSACYVYEKDDTCDTDLRRPSFAQKGNTYMWLRNIPDTTVSGTGTRNFQYYGLASEFRPIVASAQLAFAQFSPFHVILDAEYVNNVAFKKQRAGAVAVNNFGSTSTADEVARFQGGNQGWLGRLTVGNKDIKHFGDWKAWVGYKYLQSDATIDAFVDSDFGLGGTNLKGYFIGASLGLSDNVWATTRWMSADQIAGHPYSVDVVQFDLNARF